MGFNWQCLKIWGNLHHIQLPRSEHLIQRTEALESLAKISSPLGIPRFSRVSQNLPSLKTCFFYVFFPRNMASHTHPNFGSNWIQGDPGILPINNQMAAGWSQISTVDLLWNFTHCTKNLRASQASNEDLSSPQKGLTSKTTWMILDEHPTQ